MRKRVSRLLIVPCFSAVFGLFSLFAAIVALLATYGVCHFELEQLPNFQSLKEACVQNAASWSCWVSRGILAIVPAAIFGIVFLITWTWVRCPHCKKIFLLKTKRKHHPDFQTLQPLGAFWTVVFDVLLYGKFRCFKCGKPCKIGDTGDRE